MKTLLILIVPVVGFLLFLLAWAYWPIKDDAWDEDIECWHRVYWSDRDNHSDTDDSADLGCKDRDD